MDDVQFPLVKLSVKQAQLTIQEGLRVVIGDQEFLVFSTLLLSK